MRGTCTMNPPKSAVLPRIECWCSVSATLRAVNASRIPGQWGARNRASDGGATRYPNGLNRAPLDIVVRLEGQVVVISPVSGSMIPPMTLVLLRADAGRPTAGGCGLLQAIAITVHCKDAGAVIGGVGVASRIGNGVRVGAGVSSQIR